MITRKIGIIGFGSMGSMLFHGFLNSRLIDSANLFLSTRRNNTVFELKERGGTVCTTNKELVRVCDVIFICVKPLDVRDVLLEVKSELTAQKHIVSIAGSLKITAIEKLFAGKISRVMPTIISSVQEGVTLVTHNRAVTECEKKDIEAIFKCIGSIETIPEDEFELASELTSCAPGFFSEMLKQFVDAASKHTRISSAMVQYLVIKTFLGTARFMDEVSPDFDKTIKRVATKGGTTEVGVEVLRKKLPDIFDEMFIKTLERQQTRMRKIEEQYK